MCVDVAVLFYSTMVVLSSSSAIEFPKFVQNGPDATPNPEIRRDVREHDMKGDGNGVHARRYTYARLAARAAELAGAVTAHTVCVPRSSRTLHRRRAGSGGGSGV